MREKARARSVLAAGAVFLGLFGPAVARGADLGSGPLGAPLGATSSLTSSTLPSGFVEDTPFSGLTAPSTIRFAPDGRVFIAQLDGLIKVYDNLSDTTPTVFADLRTKVAFFGDRGLLGMVLDPQFTTGRPYVYVLYTYDAKIGGTAPLWNDNCPNPPGLDVDGCVVSGRLSRLDASGNETVLIKDEWCQQYSSHSVGDLQFGIDGALYVSAGDGASFTFADYGQDGSPVNPCADPPGNAPGTALSPPDAEGGTLRSQDPRTTGDPTGLDGAILRLNPDTGAPMPDNPGTGDVNARRIVAYGMRNPFRFTFRPGTTDLYFGDVGWDTWEEINRDPNPVSAVRNYGWPCYEGTGRMPSYDNLDLTICENLYASGTALGPLFTYNHNAKVSTENCSPGTSSTSGVVFYNGGTFPAAYNGALFFADYARRCIWVMFPDANGIPDPSTRQPFVDGAGYPVDLQIGPDGALYYADVADGEIRRVQAVNANQAPVAHATANPTNGPAPLTVNFDGSTSSDPNNDTLTYAWDLDGDGAFDDSTAQKPTFVYSQPGVVTVRLKVTDPGGLTSTDQLTITAGTPPTVTIASPTAGSTFAVSDSIPLSGSAVDGQGNPVPAARLTWSLVINHCSALVPTSCHTHRLQDIVGVATTTYPYPDHEYPSYLSITLTATDTSGLQASKTVRVDPKTVDLTFNSAPSGLQLSVGSETSTTPFVRTVVQRSTVAVIAPTPQSLSGSSYAFSSWSDAGAASHQFIAPTSNAAYTATYAASTCPTASGLVGAWGLDETSGTAVTDASGKGNNGTITGATRSTAGKFGSALSFTGTGNWVTVPDNASLDLTSGMTLEGWVNPTALGTTWRTLAIKENTGALVYALYANTDTQRPSGHVSTPNEVDTRGTAALALNTWTHLATTYDGATLRFFVNGTQVSSKAVTGAMPNSAGALRFGGNSVWGEYFNGLLDEIRVYNRALTATEIQTDMNNPVTCSGAPPPPVLATSPASLSFTGTAGGANPASQTISVSNTGGGTLSYTASPDSPWLSVSPASGTAPATLTVTASTVGLGAGTYTGNVTVTAAGASGSPKTIPVTLTVNPAPPGPTLAVSPASLSFSTVQGAASPAAQTLSVTNTGGGTLSFTDSDDASWMTVTPASGSAPATLTVTPSTSSLTAGTYNGAVTVTAAGATGSPKTIPVTLTVSPPPTLAVAPTTIAFTATQGGANPAAQTVSVTNTGGGSLSYTASDDAAWLTESPTSGAAPGTVSLTPSITGLAPGTYTATVTIAAAGASGSPKTVAVTLTVSSSTGPSGLVGAWGFDETSGTAVTDGSGKGNNGTITGATRSTSGKFGSALSFTGTGKWVTVPDNASLDLTTGMTLEGWVNPTALGTTWRTLAIKENTGALVYALYANTDTQRASGHVSTPTETDTRATAALALNTWTHLATTYDGATLRFYVNGTQVSSKAVTGAMPNSTGVLRFGGNNVWGEYFNGLLDEIRVYNRALTATEIQADMTTPVTRAGLRLVQRAARLAPKKVRRTPRSLLHRRTRHHRVHAIRHRTRHPRRARRHDSAVLIRSWLCVLHPDVLS